MNLVLNRLNDISWSLTYESHTSGEITPQALVIKISGGAPIHCVYSYYIFDSALEQILDIDLK